jgi:hypothetical protein
MGVTSAQDDDRWYPHLAAELPNVDGFLANNQLPHRLFGIVCAVTVKNHHEAIKAVQRINKLAP